MNDQYMCKYRGFRVFYYYYSLMCILFYFLHFFTLCMPNVFQFFYVYISFQNADIIFRAFMAFYVKFFLFVFNFFSHMYIILIIYSAIRFGVKKEENFCKKKIQIVHGMVHDCGNQG